MINCQFDSVPPAVQAKSAVVPVITPVILVMSKQLGGVTEVIVGELKQKPHAQAPPSL